VKLEFLEEVLEKLLVHGGVHKDMGKVEKDVEGVGQGWKGRGIHCIKQR
jgi:hypothetical protein